MPSFSDHNPQTGTAIAAEYARTMLLTEFLADHLPQLPWYLRNLQCALEDTSTDLEKVCAAIETQPQVRANFIRIGGIAEPGRLCHLELEHLVILLGKQRVWTTAVAAYLLNELNGTWSNAAKKEAAAIALVEANQRLAGRTHDAPEQAYVEGLLSVLGLVPLIDANCLDDEVPEWLEISPDAVRMQRKMLGMDCLELSRWIRLLWRLPLTGTYTRAFCEQAEITDSTLLPRSSQNLAPRAAPNSGTSNVILFTTKGSI
jgi:HD-like signal output (HDOD) protein